MARHYQPKRGLSVGYGRRQINRGADERIAELALYLEQNGVMRLNEAIDIFARHIVRTETMQKGRKKMLLKSAKERLSIALRSIVRRKQSSGN